ncbi:chemotaxis protein CheW [Pseudomonas shirazensis]|uniref:chemotaxis protein CheW n=1 Tax=Pseudomonas shirazensis TaxID=2745494 RepID=UPI003D2E124E
MNALPQREPATGTGKGVLYLQFRLSDQRFALDVREVVEVLALRTLKPIAQAPAWVRGILSHRGALIPVIDLAALSFAMPAAARTSTRLVVVRYHPAASATALHLGLILEQATETLRCQPDEFQPYGLDNGEAPYLGPVRQDAQGMLQRIEIDQLLSDEVRRLLFADGPAQVPG